jgi:hypothetical protein
LGLKISPAIPYGAIPDGNTLKLSIILKFAPQIIATVIKTWWKSRLHGVAVKYFDASTMINNEIGQYIIRIIPERHSPQEPSVRHLRLKSLERPYRTFNLLSIFKERVYLQLK